MKFEGLKKEKTIFISQTYSIGDFFRQPFFSFKGLYIMVYLQNYSIGDFFLLISDHEIFRWAQILVTQGALIFTYSQSKYNFLSFLQ